MSHVQERCVLIGEYQIVRVGITAIGEPNEIGGGDSAVTVNTRVPGLDAV
jgi:hypothetical protein